MFDLAILLEWLFIGLKHTFDRLFNMIKLNWWVILLTFFLISFLMKDLIVIFKAFFNFVWSAGLWKLVANIQQTDDGLIVIQTLKLALHIGVLEKLVYHICVQTAACLSTLRILLVYLMRIMRRLLIIFIANVWSLRFIMFIIGLSILVISIWIATSSPSLSRFRVDLIFILR